MAPTSAIHPDPAPSYVDRIQDFVSENRRAILIAAAAALVAAGAVYYTASRPSSGKGKSKDKKPKRKPVNNSDGPIIEEVKPKVQDVEGVSDHTAPCQPDCPPYRKCTAIRRADSRSPVRGPFPPSPTRNMHLTRFSHRNA